VFYNNYKGLQTTTVGNAQNPGLILAIINAGTARTYGAEGSINYRIAKPFTVGVNAGYLNARYKKFSNTDASVLSAFNFDHSQMIFSPKWQLSFNGNMDLPLNDKYRLVGNVLTSYQTKTLASLSTTVGEPNVSFPSYWLTNLRVGVKTTDDHVGVFLAVTNLFNKGYFVFGSSSSFGNSLVWGDPRIISGEVQFKF
jgi:iron complex outermembrane receptor protein